MLGVLMLIAALWFAFAFVFVFALCLSARRKSLPPQTEQSVTVVEDPPPRFNEAQVRPRRRRQPWPMRWRANHAN